MIGTSIAHYRITEKIGAGGMGEVFRAWDTKLERDVALKILPGAFFDDQQRTARFRREARVLASLNHPGIASIYGVEESAGRRALVLELVEGQDLAERLAAKPLPLEDALDIARQIAEAIEFAHESGIVHRDLKPGNVKITPSGAVKVLDFGLAKALEAGRSIPEADPSMSPTLTAAATQAGVVLGTPAYMSPEQATGRSVDRRSDIWSFGVVLFEMLSGTGLFSSRTVSETLAAVINQEPDWSALPSRTPPAVVYLLRRCLEKNPLERLQAIGEARVILEGVQKGDATMSLSPVSPASVSGAPPTPRSWIVSAGGTALVVLLAVAAGLTAWRAWTNPAPGPGSHRIAFEMSPAGLRLDESRRPVISPDGARIAFIREDGLWIRDLDAWEPRKVESDPNATNPAWSPDGMTLAYLVGQRLMQIPAAGGAPAQVGTLSSTYVEGMAWTDDGWIYFAGGVGPMHRIPARGGESEVVLQPDPEGFFDFHPPSAAPGGAIVYGVHRTIGADTIEVFDGKKRKVLLQVEGTQMDMPVVTDRYLLYDRRDHNDGIWAARYDPDRRELTGEPFLVAVGGRAPSVSNDGTLVYYDPGDRPMRQLVIVDRAGAVIRTIGDPQPELASPDVSPDGTRALVSIDAGEGRQVWMADLDTGDYSRVTLDESSHEIGIWLPDGERIATDTSRRGLATWITIRSADGTGAPEPVVEGFWPTFASDARTILYTAFNPGTAADIMARRLGEEESKVFLQTPKMEGGTSLSPDGKFLAYFQGEGSLPSIYMTTFPGGEGTWQVSADRGFFPAWSPRGDEIFYIDPKADGGQLALMAVPIRTSPSVNVGRAVKLFHPEQAGLFVDLEFRQLAPLKGGQAFLAARPIEQGERRRTSIVVAQDWSAGIE